MDRALPRPLDWSRAGRFTLLVAVGVLNTFLVGQAISWIVNQPAAPDWIVFEEAARRVRAGEPLYAWNDWYHYRWSPVVAYLFTLIAPLGLTLWRVAQVVAIATLPDRRVAILALLSWPFWFDIETGNTLIFTFALAWWAIRGSTAAALGYFALLTLVPRPLAVPVALWLFWQRPDLRVPALIIGAVSVVLAAGMLPQWIGALLGASADLEHELNFGPSRLIGSWWLLIGVPLAGWLTWKGRLGLASLAASPYWLPYYLLMGLLELTNPANRERPRVAARVDGAVQPHRPQP